MESVGVCCCLYGWQSDVSLQTVGTCTWSDSLVRCWLTTASDDHLRERLSACLNSSCLDVSLACLNWLEDSCDIVQHSTDTQLLLQVSDCFEQNISYWSCSMSAFSALTLLGDRKGIRPVKKWVVGCWHGYLSGARCRFAYSPADATATHCLLLQ